ncbi:metallophosphoesterase family protein [Microvirga brassicacearum]|uniref:Metallophosphoesterase n=1 Tax=Microvirga brassicacearum TaxID=2580413 RepID=A0A5N3P8F3_9HYPH|nr:metallophosphoesterase [Microvirga brassicacearum]KAB0266019.1 metallophosphoesterase [Microvirga brassicacearum]
MAPPVIALRFRDTTLGVDTIEAHRVIIDREGAVLWGWWKKDFEEDHLAYLNTLLTEPRDIFIVDRSTERMFRATAVRWLAGQPEQSDLTMVPEYYRQHVSLVFGWFYLTKIEDEPFLEDLSRQFGDHTLLKVSSVENLPAKKTVTSASISNKSCVLHLSDLHFGADYDFSPQGERQPIGGSKRTLTECITADLTRLGLVDDIAAVVVTGDFITGGDWSDEIRGQVLDEFEALRKNLQLDRDQIIAVPGNHDIVRYPKDSGISPEAISGRNQTNNKHEREFRTFVDELTGRRWQEPLNYIQRVKLRNADILVCVLNSCTILATEWTEYGFVGDKGLDALELLKTEIVERPTFRFMAMHHHLLPVADVEAPNRKGVTLSLDASKLLDVAQQVGVQVVLHGHQHMPRLAKYQTIPLMGGPASHPLHVVSNGSTGGARRPGSERNTYCVFRPGEDGVALWMRELRPDGRPGVSLYTGSLDALPAVP